jgi:hypothetical protein
MLAIAQPLRGDPTPVGASNPCGGHLTPAGGYQKGSEEVYIFSQYVHILTVGNLDVNIGTYVCT